MPKVHHGRHRYDGCQGGAYSWVVLHERSNRLSTPLAVAHERHLGRCVGIVHVSINEVACVSINAVQPAANPRERICAGPSRLDTGECCTRTTPVAGMAWHPNQGPLLNKRGAGGIHVSAVLE